MARLQRQGHQLAEDDPLDEDELLAAGVHGTDIPAHLFTLVGGRTEQVLVPEDDVAGEVFQGDSAGTIREEMGELREHYYTEDQLAVA